MKAISIYGLCVVAVFFLTGIQTTGTDKKQTAPSQLATKQIQSLETEISLLRKDVAELKESISKMDFRLFELEIAKDAHKTVELDMSSRAYERLDTDTGLFLVSVEDASPYLDGYRVKLDIGNPSSATYHGFDLTVKWNAKYDWDKYTAASYQSWQNAMREKEIPFTNSLEPGVWNTVELLLPATDGQHLEYCSVSMQTRAISLR